MMVHQIASTHVDFAGLVLLQDVYFNLTTLDSDALTQASNWLKFLVHRTNYNDITDL